MVDNLAKCVEREKMKAIGARNHLKSIAKERESQKQQLQALIAEKKMQLERLVALKAVNLLITSVERFMKVQQIHLSHTNIPGKSSQCLLSHEHRGA